MKILFVTSNRLGDAVLSTGLLDHLIRTHPDALITVVCGPVAEGVFERMPNRERTIVLRKLSWGRHWVPLWSDVALQPVGSGRRHSGIGAVLGRPDTPARGLSPHRRPQNRSARCNSGPVAAADAGCMDK